MLARLAQSSTLKIKQVYYWLFLNQCNICDAPSNLSLCADCLEQLPQLTTCCPQCALPNLHGLICGSCLQNPPSFQRAIVPYLYHPPVSQLLRGWKYHNQYRHNWLIKTLANQLTGIRVDAIVPVPSHWRRKLLRGRDHTQEIANILSKQLKTPTLLGLKRQRRTPTQRGLDKQQRQHNLKNAFTIQADVSGLNLLLVDDVMTTGTTLEMASNELIKSGAKSITVACVARTPVKHIQP